MKKKYLSPVAEKLEIEEEEILAGSGENGTSSSQNRGEGGQTQPSTGNEGDEEEDGSLAKGYSPIFDSEF